MYKNISTTAQDLIYLIACAVNSQAPKKDKCRKMDFDKLYKLAEFHSLCSITASALEQTVTLPQSFFEAKKKAIRKLALFDIERKAILNEFENKGIWYLPLKGIVLKDIYPKQSYREMTDNDILCDSGKMAEIKAIMVSRKYTCKLYGKTNHDVYSKPPVIAFEMHSALFNKREEPMLSDYYNDIKEKLIKLDGTGYGYKMTDEDFYIYLICHFYLHYNLSGTGLRSLLDVYVYNKKFSSLNREYISKEFEKLGIAEFEENARTLSKKLYGGELLSEKEQKELEFYLKSGSAGTIQNYFEGRLNHDDSPDSKRKYLLKRVFPSYDSLKEKSPALKRHKILYPAFLVYRPFKGLITHPKTIFREYKIVKNYKNEESVDKQTDK